MPKYSICVGCGAACDPAAFAIMHERDFEAIQAIPSVIGPGYYHAGATCKACFVTPSHRKVLLKAHFTLPAGLTRMLELAGSSGNIGGE